MAKSKYEYVRLYEQPDRLPLGNWIVIRIDGRGFHRFSNKHGFAKPNDIRAIKLMNKAAEGVLRDVQDIVLGYGVSDEYSFLLHHSTNLYSRRASKLIATVVSTFTAHYITQWPAYFPRSPLATLSTPSATTAEEEKAASSLGDAPHRTTNPGTDPEIEDSLEPSLIPTGPVPTFDGRAICYPRIKEVRDYFAWRQADCHVNNLYNTTFWALVQQGGMGNHEAEQALARTVAAEKNEILWRRFGVNYNNEAKVYRKGSVIFRERDGVAINHSLEVGSGSHGGDLSGTQLAKLERARKKSKIVVIHQDIIGDHFWNERPWLLVE